MSYVPYAACRTLSKSQIASYGVLRQSFYRKSNHVHHNPARKYKLEIFAVTRRLNHLLFYLKVYLIKLMK